MSRSTINNNEALIQSLRDAADYLETHPDIPKLQPHQRLWEWVSSKEEFMEFARTIGSYRKEFTEGNMPMVKLIHNFGGLNLDIQISRDRLCKQVVTWECPDESWLEILKPEAGQ